MTEKVCLVTATWNRRPILQQCLSAVRAQTCPPHQILVVNNGSTDDTQAWLEGQADIRVIHQSNIGTAGGFRAGILAALDTECDWLWLMDDDVVPAPNALEELVRVLRAHPEQRVLNSLCLGVRDTARPSAGALRLRSNPHNFLHGEYLYSLEQIRARANAEGILDSAGGQLYLGTLIHRSVVEKIGAPIAWFVTRGDEVEYALRMMQAGYHIWTVTSSIVTHPDTPITFVSLLGQKFPFERMSPIKRYYSIRNSIFLRRTYYAGAPFLPYAARRLMGALVTAWFATGMPGWRERVRDSRAALAGTWDGIYMAWDFSSRAQEAYDNR